MAPARLSTGDYTEADRTRLATAVLRARETAGPWSQQQLAERAKVSKRSIIYLENAEPRVGRRVLEAVGRALPGWTEDTPLQILEGGAPPTAETTPDRPEPRPEDYPDRMEYFTAMYWHMREQMGWSEEAILSGFDAAAKIYIARKVAERDEQSTRRDKLG